MNSFQAAAFAAALLLAGCGDDPPPGADAGGTSADAGTRADAGSAPFDSGADDSGASRDAAMQAACDLPASELVLFLDGDRGVASFCWGVVAPESFERCSVRMRSNCDLDGSPAPNYLVASFTRSTGERTLMIGPPRASRITATSHGTLDPSEIGDTIEEIPDATDVTITVDGTRTGVLRFDGESFSMRSWM